MNWISRKRLQRTIHLPTPVPFSKVVQIKDVDGRRVVRDEFLLIHGLQDVLQVVAVGPRHLGESWRNAIFFIMKNFKAFAGVGLKANHELSDLLLKAATNMYSAENSITTESSVYFNIFSPEF